MKWMLILKIHQKLNKMKTEIKTLLHMKHFFQILSTKSEHIKYTHKTPSQILMKNIHINWLQYIHTKTHKHMPVYINNCMTLNSVPSVFGIISQNLHKYTDDEILEQKLTEPINGRSKLQFELFVPQQDIMQHFIKWQRYRKYWWSSVSTTPSLFSINDIKYEGDTANVDVIAQLPSGQQVVESILIKSDENGSRTTCLRCTMFLEVALFTLLLDGLTNNRKEEHLRLHRNIAPYKISFALNHKDSKEKSTLNELAILLYHKLESKKISTWLPDFTQSVASQITENRKMGVTYTAVLSESTLENGIFKLLSSSTMLGESVHVADFVSYAEIIFGRS